MKPELELEAESEETGTFSGLWIISLFLVVVALAFGYQISDHYFAPRTTADVLGDYWNMRSLEVTLSDQYAIGQGKAVESYCASTRGVITLRGSYLTCSYLPSGNGSTSDRALVEVYLTANDAQSAADVQSYERMFPRISGTDLTYQELVSQKAQPIMSETVTLRE